MWILFFWIVILCCSAANGYLFEEYGMPENFIFMLIPSVICGGILWWHRRVTKNWERPLDGWNYHSYRFPIFWVSMVIGIIAFLFVLFLSYYMSIPYKWAILVSIGTLVMASFIANKREKNYSAFWVIWEPLSTKRR